MIVTIYVRGMRNIARDLEEKLPGIDDIFGTLAGRVIDLIGVSELYLTLNR